MIFSFSRVFLLFACIHICPIHAEEAAQPKKEDQKAGDEVRACRELSRTQHSLNIKGSALEYEAICGVLPLNSSDDKTRANIYFTSYVKKERNNASNKRPILFCFNGGPGSSSLWLHIGLLGPKMAQVIDARFTPPPATYVDNPYTLLDQADLVFIDPVSTGFSKPAADTDAKQFHSVEGDAESFADFIRLFLTHYQRWQSPRYLVGESYGTIRAVSLASILHDTYFIDLNGIVLISMCLDLQAYDFGNGNDLPYILTLPSYAATAWYHQKLPEAMQKKALSEIIAEVEEFALHDYATALLLGDELDSEAKDQIVARLAAYTGLSKEFIKASHLRILNNNFYHELLKDQSKVLGRFDGRYTTYDANHLEEPMIVPDPSFDAVTGPFTSAFHQYLYQELKLEKNDPYYALNPNVFPWNFSVDKVPAGLGYVYISGKLRQLMEKNPRMQVFVLSGYYDLATPYFAANYTLNHLKLVPALRKNIEVRSYEAGHMMYLNPPSHAQIKADLVQFLNKK